MSLENFFNPADEDEPPGEGAVSSDQELWDLITQYFGVSEEFTMNEEQAIEGEAIEERPIRTATQALEALETLIYWQQHQQLSTTDGIRHMSKLERLLHVHIANSQQQATFRWVVYINSFAESATLDKAISRYNDSIAVPRLYRATKRSL